MARQRPLGFSLVIHATDLTVAVVERSMESSSDTKPKPPKRNATLSSFSWANLPPLTIRRVTRRDPGLYRTKRRKSAYEAGREHDVFCVRRRGDPGISGGFHLFISFIFTSVGSSPFVHRNRHSRQTRSP